MFEQIIGQNDARKRLSIYIDGLKNGGTPRSSIILGQTGLGKTHLNESLLAEYRARGFNTEFNFSCPSEILGAPFTMLADAIRNGEKLAVHIDECHRIKDGRADLKRLSRFIMSFTDEKKRGTPINIDDGKIGTDSVDWNQLVFLLGTNFPGKLEEGAQSTSFVDRLMKISLDPYSHEEIVKILGIMLTKMSVKIHESTIKLVANCARGTARPLQLISHELKAIQLTSGDGNSLNREQVLEAIRLAKCYPGGLSVHEVRFLAVCVKQSLKQNQLIAAFPSVEPRSIRESLAWLCMDHSEQEGLKALMGHTSSGYSITETGRRYLLQIHKAGFRW